MRLIARAGLLFALVCVPVFALFSLPQLYAADVKSSELNGKWKGEYGYQNKTRVYFHWKVKAHGNDLTGTIVEPNTLGDGSVLILRSSVVGKIDGNKVHFTKTYDGSGGVNHSVVYDGIYDSKTKTITGHWTLPQGDSGSFTATKD